MRILVAAVATLVLAAPAAAVTATPPPWPPGVDVDPSGEAAVAFLTPEGVSRASGGAAGFDAASPVGIHGHRFLFGRPWVGPREHNAVAGQAQLRYYELDPQLGGVTLFATSGRGGIEQLDLDPQTAAFDADLEPGEAAIVAHGDATQASVEVAGDYGFGTMREPTPLRPAVAATRRAAVVVGSACLTCDLVVRELTSLFSYDFTPPAAIPSTAGLTDYDLDLAADRGLVLAGVRDGRVFVSLRPTGDAWTAPIDLGAGSRPTVGIADGGRAVVAFDAGDDYRAIDVTVDATSEALRVAGDVAFPSVSVREDNAAAVATAGGVYARQPGGAFELVETPAGTHAVDYEQSGLLIGTNSAGDYYATFNGKTTKVGEYPVVVTPPPVAKRVPVTTFAGPLRVRAGRVLVPLRCREGGDVYCAGRVNGERFQLPAGTGRSVEFAIADAARNFRFTLREGGSTRAFTRKLRRSPTTCGIARWARVLASRDGVRIASESYPDGTGTTVACTPEDRRRNLAPSASSAAAIRGDAAAFVSVHGNKHTLHRLDLDGTEQTKRPLLTGEDREVLTMRLARAGDVVMVDRIEDVLRIRAIGAGNDRLVTLGERIDPASLEIRYARIYWRDAGATGDPQIARLREKPPR